MLLVVELHFVVIVCVVRGGRGLGFLNFIDADLRGTRKFNGIVKWDLGFFIGQLMMLHLDDPHPTLSM